MAKKSYYPTVTYPNILVLGIHAPYNRTKNIQAYYDEFMNLVRTNDVTYTTSFFMKIRSIDPVYFLTKGKREELNAFCQEHAIEEIIISEPLTAMQERNLEDMLDCRIYDRTHLILEIFEKAAHSAEGKTQVAIAFLQHKKTRLAGKGIFLSQQTGFIGGRGPGETLKEKETRHIERMIAQHKKQLKKIEQSREVRRKQRKKRNVPHICLIGYTNAGKSSLLNALTKSSVLAEDKLFATLDTTTRELYIEGTKIGLLSDSVGFIQQLPHHLVAAFKSTLDELNYADLLIHVVDISNPNWMEQIKTVHELLEELNINTEMIYVFNKADLVDEEDLPFGAMNTFRPYFVLSAHDKQQLTELKQFLLSWNR